MGAIDDIREQVQGLPLGEASTIVRDAREAASIKRNACNDELSRLNDMGADDEKAETELQTLREKLAAQRGAAQQLASDLNALLLEIEGVPEPEQPKAPVFTVGTREGND